MIFVSVGTHEQGFERLIKKIDDSLVAGVIQETTFIQVGYSRYIPRSCHYEKMLMYKDMVQKIRDCRIYITHGGPGNIFLGIQNGKVPIVVPRKFEFKEHVDNHQVRFAMRLAETNRIIPVYDIELLPKIIAEYDDIVTKRVSCKERNTRNLDSNLIEKLKYYTSTLENIR